MSFKLWESLNPRSKNELVRAYIYIKEPNFDEKFQAMFLDLQVYGRSYYKFDEDGRIVNVSYTQVEGKEYGKSPSESIRDSFNESELESLGRVEFNLKRLRPRILRDDCISKEG